MFNTQILSENIDQKKNLFMHEFAYAFFQPVVNKNWLSVT